MGCITIVGRRRQQLTEARTRQLHARHRLRIRTEAIGNYLRGI
jgi:hypothetical protein